jgi:hypothetical protein
MENVRAVLASIEILESTKDHRTEKACCENIRTHAHILSDKIQRLELKNKIMAANMKRLEGLLESADPRKILRVMPDEEL